jgi:hypothetical protein
VECGGTWSEEAVKDVLRMNNDAPIRNIPQQCGSFSAKARLT